MIQLIRTIGSKRLFVGLHQNIIENRFNIVYFLLFLFVVFGLNLLQAPFHQISALHANSEAQSHTQCKMAAKTHRMELATKTTNIEKGNTQYCKFK